MPVLAARIIYAIEKQWRPIVQGVGLYEGGTMRPHRLGGQQTVVQLCFCLLRIEIPKLMKRHPRNTFPVFDIETEYLYLHLRGVRRNDYSEFYQPTWHALALEILSQKLYKFDCDSFLCMVVKLPAPCKLLTSDSNLQGKRVSE